LGQERAPARPSHGTPLTGYCISLERAFSADCKASPVSSSRLELPLLDPSVAASSGSSIWRPPELAGMSFVGRTRPSVLGEWLLSSPGSCSESLAQRSLDSHANVSERFESRAKRCMSARRCCATGDRFRAGRDSPSPSPRPSSSFTGVESDTR
jgi:hypothetical protein